MNHTFVEFFQLSLRISSIIVAILLLRFCTSKLPKVFHYFLWSFVLLGMIPFKFTSEVSIQHIPIQIEEIIFQNNSSSQMIVQETNSSLITILDAFTTIWIIGMILFFIFYIKSYVQVRKATQFAIKKDFYVFESDEITSPFLFGIVTPKIYLPSNLDEEAREHVLAHEFMHMKRKDYLVQCFANIILAINWYNLVVWVGYYAFIQDLEFSCDECVLREKGAAYKSKFAHSILDMILYHNFMVLSLKSSNTKKRILHIMNYRKPSLKITMICILLGLCLSIPLLSQPTIVSALPVWQGHDAVSRQDQEVNSSQNQDTIESDELSITFISPMSDYTVTCGWLCYSGHYAFDIKAENTHADVYAIADAVVQVVAFDQTYGNYIILEHVGGYTSFYAHLSDIYVESGETIQQAHVIGNQGKTGIATGEHLHFYIAKDNVVLETSLELTN